MPLRTIPAPRRFPLWPLLLLAAVAAGAGLWYWLELRAAPQRRAAAVPPSPLGGEGPGVRGRNTTDVPQTLPIIEPKKAPQPTQLNLKGEVSVEALLGNGIALSDWLRDLRRAAPNLIHCTPPDLENSLPSLQLSDYDGDGNLPLQEALELLCYAGVSVARAADGTGYDVSWPDSSAQLRDALSGGISPDHPSWGALRSWEHFTLRAVAVLPSPLGGEGPGMRGGLVDLRTLAWSLPGRTCLIENRSDGQVEQTRTQLPAATELDAALAAFVTKAADPASRADAVAGLGAILRAEPAGQESPRAAQAFATLRDLLNSNDLDTARSSALALSGSQFVPAIDALFGVVEKKDADVTLKTAALCALASCEKSGRQLDERTLGAEGWTKRMAAYRRLRDWLIANDAHFTDANTSRDAITNRDRKGAAITELADFAATCLRIAEPLGALPELPHLKDYCSRNPVALHSLAAAGPNWRHVPFEIDDAVRLLRIGERRSVSAALWRFNRQGADTAMAAPIENSAAPLAEQIQAIWKESPSAHQRALALEALYRDSRATPRGTEPWRLCNESGFAVQAFLNDPAPAAQRAAASALGRLAGVVQIDALQRADLAAHPRAGTDLLLNNLVQRFWLANPENGEEASPSLSALVDQLLVSSDPLVAQRAAWAKMKAPDVELSEKLRAAKAMKDPALRVAALNALHGTRAIADFAPKYISVFVYDDAPAVREALFSANLPDVLKPSLERAKLFAHALEDADAAVRLAALKCRTATAADVRAAILERVRVLAEKDASAEVRTAAEAWLRASPRNSTKER
ncbi:MAG TPA: hypothetical protein VKX17_02615 [Planctomycetota bacterium]|nr:hypothetical protein [Planctomycetota bacterium]